MDYTFATVIVNKEFQKQAQEELGSEVFFSTALSFSGSFPATHYMSSGAFNNDEMEKIVNLVDWPNKVYFGQDWQAAVDNEGLKLAQETVEVKPS